MRFLNKVDEFKQETTNALFTKEQALAVTIKMCIRDSYRVLAL